MTTNVDAGRGTGGSEKRGFTHTLLLRPSEWLLGIYFTFVAVRGFLGGASAEGSIVWLAALLGGGTAIALLAQAENRTGSRACGIVRDWLPAPLLLVAYWAVDWPPASNYRIDLERGWIQFDRTLLIGWGGKAAIESLGRTLPFVLEFCYSLLYVVPPVSIGVLYLYRRRDRVDRFLFTLLLGALTTYALLPLFPSRSPRVAFAGEDLPAFDTLFRDLNVWLLDCCDIRASVFPSGHVTVGFSAAFAMLLALPERRRVAAAIAAVACAVSVVTVYGRYHYAVDGLAAVAVSLAAYAVSRIIHPELRRTSLSRGSS